MAEYVMGPDDNRADVARSLHEHAGPERAGEIEWRPRPNVPGGGVFVMPDDLAEGYSSDRLSRLDDNAKGEMINLATDGRTAEQKDPTEMNDAVAAGRARTAASPATGANPLTPDAPDPSDTPTTRSRRAARRASTDSTTKE